MAHKGPVPKPAAPKKEVLPISALDLLVERGAYEERILDQIKTAVDANDRNKVFKLAKALFYEGPGIATKS
jgi:hypothetical protein